MTNTEKIKKLKSRLRDIEERVKHLEDHQDDDIEYALGDNNTL